MNDLLQSDGVDIAVKACYDVRESSAFWNKWALHSQLADDSDSDNSDIPQWLSTHPNHENRAKRLDGMIPAVSTVNVYYDNILWCFYASLIIKKAREELCVQVVCRHMRGHMLKTC